MDASNWLGIAQDVGTLVLFTVTPWLDVPATRRLRMRPESMARLALYRRVCLGLWLGLTYVFVVAGPTRIWTITRTPGEWTWLDSSFGAAAAMLICAAFFAVGIWPALQGLRDPAVRARYTRAMQPFAFFLPASLQERRWWAALSISAGVCEEFVMRGFLIQYFRGALEGSLHLGLTSAVLLAAAAFGLNHAYQGVGNVLRTALAGFLLALLSLLSGSLLLPIVVHVLADLCALALYRPDEDTAGNARAAPQAL